ncbi:MAG: DEAD/DEAH box helicase family protein [Anaerolineae bacterium]|nr:DEAD/DEAH box helicase family protein [Anaerolineae bacterium]
MTKDDPNGTISANSLVRVQGRDELGTGQVLRIAETGGVYQADIVFERADGRRLETWPLERLSPERDPWERLDAGDLDPAPDFLLKQLAYRLPRSNSGGELSNSRTDLLPHQILLTYDIVARQRRRLLIADEVGLGKTIEAGMIVRELISRSEARRILIVCPAGLIENWQNEFRDGFRLYFDVLGRDFTDANPTVWETHHHVIASIDTLKQPRRMARLKASPRWDVIVFDEAHHLSRTRYGRRVNTTQNYKLADTLRTHTRDLFFLSATPHQGDAYQFWSLIQLLDDGLFEDEAALLNHRGLLNRVMIRRTKREVTDAQGAPIFMRRQVITQTFAMSLRERRFYERLTEYLREGYSVAGVGEEKTSSLQRAIGFVMTTFQKIMSSSPRAIRQALRRRLIVLLLRELIDLERQVAQGGVRPHLSTRIVTLQDELRRLAIEFLALPESVARYAEADAFISRMKQQLARKQAQEITHWSLDSDESGDEDVLFAETDIPDEADKVRELLALVPTETDRKFHTLLRAIEQLQRENPAERFIIFSQYLETIFYLRDELARFYGSDKIVIIRGGPLEDKIAAVEAFWQPDGAQFLLSTSAGGEGINLQIGRILFNYDLPWNPMAVEQRIGRIHRYGQRDTVQVYNLVAEDTVEERIYGLLEDKLLEIALAIGKVDPVTGEVVEDFRSEVLGFLGTSPDYQNLYRKALIDRDYHRTEREIAEAIENARRASEALRALTQELDTFNLEHYRQLQGELNLSDLYVFVEQGILRLGGAILPDGESLCIHVPEALWAYPQVARTYEHVVFDRAVAMRRRKAQLLGLGHPLVDALVSHFSAPRVRGQVTVFPEADAVSARYIIEAEMENGRQRSDYHEFVVGLDGTWQKASARRDVIGLQNRLVDAGIGLSLPGSVREQIEAAVRAAEATIRAETDQVVTVRSRLVGLAGCGAV